MFLTDYTAITRIGHSLDAPHPNGWMNLLMHARGDAQQIPMHTTSLSLYSVFRGTERHEVGRARFAVTPERYLGSDVYSAATLPLEAQLEDPNQRVPLEFFERTYPRDARLSQLLGWLRIFIWAEVTQDPLEQAMQPVLERLLILHRNLDAQIEAQPAAKRSTREELFRRLHVARDYIRPLA
jgi:hypothetical protein